MSASLEDRRFSLSKVSKHFSLGAVTGVAGVLFGRYILRSTGFDLRLMGWEDGLALALGLVFLVFAAGTAIASLRGKSVLPDGMDKLQSIVFALGGLMYMAPVLVSQAVPPVWLFAGLALALVLQSVVNGIVWQQADEMLRRLTIETSTITLFSVQGVFFLYAAAERLGLITPISLWGLSGLLTVVYLISSLIPSLRRGVA